MPCKQEVAERLGAKISELCSYIYAAEHRLLTLIREFDQQEGWAHLGFHSCAYWLNFKCGIDMNTARERVRVAHALGRLPKIDARFAKGAISYSKVRAVTRIAGEADEDYLLMISKHGTAHHVEKLVRLYRRAERLQDTEAAKERHDNRQISYHYDHDGCLVIKGRFPAEQGALIVKALEMAMERQHAQGDPSTVGAASATVGAASAIVGAASAAKDVSADHVPSGQTPEPTPVATRRADALAEVAETYMNTEPVANSTADRYQVVVHVAATNSATVDVSPVGAASAATNVSAETSHLENGPHVSAETSRRIACDSSVLRIDEDKNGEPLAIGRKSRSIPPAMRRALRMRDKGCRFPGCTNDKFIDGHHIEHWADGGETNLDNLVLLCRHHHHLVHEGGFGCEKTAAGKLIFKDQRNTPLPHWSLLPTVGDDDINEWLDREFFDRGIDADTCRSQWYAGERMDWNLAVGHLFSGHSCGVSADHVPSG
jgi:hypothetical protein